MSNAIKNISSEEQLRRIVREEVTAALEQFVDDPGAGLQVSHDFKEKLKAAAAVSDEDLIPFSEIIDQVEDKSRVGVCIDKKN